MRGCVDVDVDVDVWMVDDDKYTYIPCQEEVRCQICSSIYIIEFTNFRDDVYREFTRIYGKI